MNWKKEIIYRASKLLGSYFYNEKILPKYPNSIYIIAVLKAFIGAVQLFVAEYFILLLLVFSGYGSIFGAFHSTAGLYILPLLYFFFSVVSSFKKFDQKDT